MEFKKISQTLPFIYQSPLLHGHTCTPPPSPPPTPWIRGNENNHHMGFSLKLNLIDCFGITSALTFFGGGGDKNDVLMKQRCCPETVISDKESTYTCTCTILWVILCETSYSSIVRYFSVCILNFILVTLLYMYVNGSLKYLQQLKLSQN